MAQKIDPSKLFPSSGASDTSQESEDDKISGYLILIESSFKKIDLKPSSLILVSDEQKSKELVEIRDRVIKIDKLLKSDFKISQKKTEVTRKEKEKEEFDKNEKKLETPKIKGAKLPNLPSPPNLSIFDKIKRFLFFTGLGWLLPKVLEFLPKLEGFGKTIQKIGDFAGKIFDKMHDAFDNLVKFGSDMATKTLGFISDISGGNAKDFEKKFTALQTLFDKYVDLSIIAGLLGLDLGMAGLNEWRKGGAGARGGASGARGGASGARGGASGARMGGRPQVTTSGGRPVNRPNIRNPFRGRPQVTTSGGRPVNRPNIRNPFRGRPQVTQGASALEGVEGAAARTRFRLPKIGQLRAGGLLSLLLLIPTVIDVIRLGTEGRGKDAVRTVLNTVASTVAGMAAYSAFIAGAAALGVTGIGLPAAIGLVIGGLAASGLAGWAAYEGSDRALKAMGLEDIDPKTGKAYTYSRGGRVIGRYQRGGRIVGKYQSGGIKNASGSAPGRTLKIKPRRSQSKLPPPKTQPGKDVGGIKKVLKLYPDTTKSKKLSYDDWLTTNMPGDYGDYEWWFDNQENKPNPYKAITSTAALLKDIPFVGGIMGASVDIIMGQRPDKSIYSKFANGIVNLIDYFSEQKVDKSLETLRSQINSFAGGGTVPSRELSESNIDVSKVLSKVIENAITKKVNEAIQNVAKELNIGNKLVQPEDQTDSTGNQEVRAIIGNDDVALDLLNYFAGRLGINAAYGIVANLRRESGANFDPTTPQSDFEGIAQWDRQYRWPRLVSWARERGLDPNSRNAQAEYIIVEMDLIGRNLKNRLRNARTPDEAAKIFFEDFEVAAESQRIRGASYNPNNEQERQNRRFTAALVQMYTGKVGTEAGIAGVSQPVITAVGQVNGSNSTLATLGSTSKLHYTPDSRGGNSGKCVTAVLETMKLNHIPNPDNTGKDSSNSRGLIVQLIKSFGWISLPGIGRRMKLVSPGYGEVYVNALTYQQYVNAVESNRVPSGALVFQTRHRDWNVTTGSAGGYDSAIARNGGRSLFNGVMVNSTAIYQNVRQVIVLVPSRSVTQPPSQPRGSETSGRVSIYAGHADMTRNSPGRDFGTWGGLTRLVPGAIAGGYLSNEAYINDLIAGAFNGSSLATYRRPIRTQGNRDPGSNWTRASNDVHSGITPFEIHHDQPAGNSGLMMGANYEARKRSNKYIKAMDIAYGPHPSREAKGFFRDGGAIVEVSKLTPAILKDQSTINRHVQSQVSKISNALRSAQTMEGGGLISKSKLNLPIPNSFASYDSPENRTSVVLLPVMVPTPVPSSKNSGVSFSMPIAIVENNIDIQKALNSSRGY